MYALVFKMEEWNIKREQFKKQKREEIGSVVGQVEGRHDRQEMMKCVRLHGDIGRSLSRFSIPLF